MSVIVAAAHVPPALSLFTGDQPPGEWDARLSPDTTLREFVRRWFVPHYCRKLRRPLKPRSEAEFSTAVGRWVLIFGDTRLRDCSLDLCRQFVEADFLMPGMRRGRTLSPRTVAKHCGALQTIFHMAAPRTERHKDAYDDDGLFGLDRTGRPRTAPWFPAIQLPDHIQDRVFELAEIHAWLEACQYARQPLLRECRPDAWWRALILFLYNSGPRIGATLKLRRRMVQRKGGRVWLEVPGEISKQGRAKLSLLSSHAVAAIDSIPTLDLIFPWPHSPKHLQTIRRELQTAAGIAPERQFGFQALRATNATEVFCLDPRAAQENLGHRSIGTTIGSYVGARGLIGAQAARIGPALEALPQPAGADPQRRLF